MNSLLGAFAIKLNVTTRDSKSRIYDRSVLCFITRGGVQHFLTSDSSTHTRGKEHYFAKQLNIFSSVGVWDKEETCKSPVAISFLPPSFPVDPLPSPGFRHIKNAVIQSFLYLRARLRKSIHSSRLSYRHTTPHRPQQVEVAWWTLITEAKQRRHKTHDRRRRTEGGTGDKLRGKSNRRKGLKCRRQRESEHNETFKRAFTRAVNMASNKAFNGACMIG